jgi:hypothetical protein
MIGSEYILMTRNQKFLSKHSEKNKNVNKFSLEKMKIHLMKYFEFDYIDPGDGIVIELLHTSKKYPKILGNVRGFQRYFRLWSYKF